MSAREEERLDSWKEIATYLERDIRTVRRWEKERALPIHRLPGGGRRAVFAYAAEIDEWLRGAGAEADLNQNTSEGTPATDDRTQGLALAPPEFNDRTSLLSGVLSNPSRFDATGSKQGNFRAGLRWGVFLILAAVAVTVVWGRMVRGHGKLASADPPASRPTAVSSVSAMPWKPEVLSIQFTGRPHDLGMEVNGLGFGKPKTRLPFTGEIPWFRIGDVSCYATAPGTCEAGYTGDTDPLTFSTWNNGQIAFAHFRLPSGGDAIELSVWNPESKSPQSAAVWGGNVPPVRPGTPRISSVKFSGFGKQLHITIRGQNFGQAPPGVPGVGNTPFLEFGDYAYHQANVPLSTFFRAGYQNNTIVCGITLQYVSWTEHKIEIGGFGGSYGQDGMRVQPGDPVAIDLWNTQNHLATAWGGRIP